jgi:predicted transcriptional regulator
LHSKTRKIKIQLQDDDGDKYNLSLEGVLSKEKMLKILTLIDSLDNNVSDTTLQCHASHLQNNTNLDTLGAKVWNIIQNEIKDTNFTSNDVLKAYSRIYRESTELSIISTYLTRFFSKNKLTRRKHGKEWMYTISNSQPSQKVSVPYNEYTSPHSSNALIRHYEKPSTVYDLHQ